MMNETVELPLTPPYPLSFIATGVRHENGVETKVYLSWTDEGGGWYQWDTNKSRAKKFKSVTSAISAASCCPGPWYYIPMKSTMTVEEVESDKAEEYRRVIKDALEVINKND